MARTSVSNSVPTTPLSTKATTPAELKMEVQKLVSFIINNNDGDGNNDNDDDNIIETIDQVVLRLSALKEIELKKRVSVSTKICGDGGNGTGNGNVSCPEEFECPISQEIMKDPVIVSSGQTYDRSSIEKWLKAGNRTCPRTQQVLSLTDLTPNCLIKEMISRWCRNQQISLPKSVHYVDEHCLTQTEKDHFHSLLRKLTATTPEQKRAAKELRLLTKSTPSCRALFGESPDNINQLLQPLSRNSSNNGPSHDLQEDIITTLLNISIHDNNKKLVAEIPAAIPLLMDALRYGNIETKSNAAAALFTLSALDSNKELIGSAGALKPLIALLDQGHPLTIKDVASAIFNLCILHENKARAVQGGAVSVILRKIASRVHVDELLAILAMLSTHHRAIIEMGDLGAVPCLFGVIREDSCARNKENCIAVLHTICFNDRTKWRELREEENTHKTISELAQSGTLRAKRKAGAILERLNRVINLTHTA